MIEWVSCDKCLTCDSAFHRCKQLGLPASSSLLELLSDLEKTPEVIGDDLNETTDKQ